MSNENQRTDGRNDGNQRTDGRNDRNRRTDGGEDRPRARELGIDPWVEQPGAENTLTDVPGVRIGHERIIDERNRGGDPRSVRTGVTAIWPSAHDPATDPVTGATHIINAFGKSVGFDQVAELGEIETPILLTNTLNVWRVADALAEYVMDRTPDVRTINPVVGECNDGRLSDIRGRHVTAEHVHRALDTATEPNVEEGNVGAGTGMTGFGWKGGIGTASRVVTVDDREVTVGTLVQTNTGRREELRIPGIPSGARLWTDGEGEEESTDGSIVMVVGTDAPVTSRQLERVARRTALGLGRVGGVASHGSGDVALAFSNGDPTDAPLDDELTPLFRGTVEATEEAILNSLFRAETMTGRDGTTVRGLPIDDVRDALAAE